MNTYLRLVAGILGVTFVIGAAPPPQSAYTRSMFTRGLRDGYVLIRIQEGNKPRIRYVCTMGAFLLGGLHLEYQLNYNGREKRAEEIAIRHWNQVFTFKNRKAMANVEPRYTFAQLAEVRRRLKDMDRSSLSEQLRASHSALHRIYRTKSQPERSAYRDAIAHVLLENGILVRMADITGQLRPLENEKPWPTNKRRKGSNLKGVLPKAFAVDSLGYF